MVRTVAEIGYEWIELSPREEFMPFFLHPRADDEKVAELKTVLRETGVRPASVLPLYKWSSPDETERQAAVRYWKRMIEVTAELGCELMNSEFNGRPERAAESEAAFWRSLEELLPVFEREGIALNLEAHPDDFCEVNDPAVDLQHLDIGQGEVDWDAFFGTLRDTGFDGVATVCVFAWEERAVESSKFMLDRVTKELAG
jgi:myo-inositol catabolism protein IolH